MPPEDDDAATRAEGHYAIGCSLHVATEAMKAGRGVRIEVDICDGEALPARVRLAVTIDPKAGSDGGEQTA